MKDTDGTQRPMWRTRWMAPEGRTVDLPHPPVLLMFNHIGARDPNRTVPRLQELTRPLWQGYRVEDHHLYGGNTPIIAAGLRNLREHGPAGEVFHRFGRDHWQPLREAIGNPRREAADTRRRAEYAAREREHQGRAAEQQKAEREAAGHHRPTPSPAGRVGAPGAGPGGARAEGRERLALTFPHRLRVTRMGRLPTLGNRPPTGL